MLHYRERLRNRRYAKFVKQLNQLREEFRSVHRGKEVRGVPDIDGPMEVLTRTLTKENEENFGKMLAMSSKWLLSQVNMLFKILDECSTKFNVAWVSRVPLITTAPKTPEIVPRKNIR